MVKSNDQLRHDTVENFRGGKGSVKFIHILEKDQFHNKGRLFAHHIIKPGSSTGYHKHEADFEAYYIIKGEGTFNDNGELRPVKKGDLALTEIGESHCIENTGTEDLEFLGLVLFE